MVKLASTNQCCGCHACASVCPRGAIAMERDREGFLYPVVKEDSCIGCLRCEKVCPILSEKKGRAEELPKAYAMWNKNEAVRKESTSGGVFTAIAEWVLVRGGVVFGAALDGACAVRHIAVEKKEELSLLRGSKYLQSTIGDAYRQARDYLAAGRIVLFSGTPCQIGGLRAYLGREYENLICQDVVCHGVPSSAVWERVVGEYERESGKTVSSVAFRSKVTGWKKYSLVFTHTDGSVNTHLSGEDLFMKGFLRDLYLRPSCYRCAFKGYRREADLTLADFWGIEHILPEIDDDGGTSLVLAHTARGEALLLSVDGAVERREIDVTEAARYNPSMLYASKNEKGRAVFWHDFNRLSLRRAIGRHTKPSFVKRCKRAVRRVLSLILK